jgi:hypothetical protein
MTTVSGVPTPAPPYSSGRRFRTSRGRQVVDERGRISPLAVAVTPVVVVVPRTDLADALPDESLLVGEVDEVRQSSSHSSG